MSNPTNDPYRRDGYDGRGPDPRAGHHDPAYDARRDAAYDDRAGRRDPAYDDRSVDREVYVERDRVVAPPQEQVATVPKPNPGAGILLIIGGLMGVLAGLIPGGSGKMPIAGSIDLFKSGETNAIILGAAIVLVFLCGLGALAAGAQMFAPKWHGGPSRTGMTMGILMLIASLALIVVVGSSIFDGAELWTWLLLLACIPTIIGALIGFSRK